MNAKENNPFNSDSGNFGLPEGYFQKSASSIFNKVEWEEEHKAYPTLYQLKNKNGFAVPQNYFIKNESDLELLLYPALKSVSKKSGFSVPDAYFEETETRAFAKLWNESDEELSSFEKLKSLPKQNGFKTPENYFELKSKKLENHLIENKTGRVIHLFTGRIAFAAAALLMLALGLWIYSTLMKPVSAPVDCGSIACVDKLDVIESKSLDNLEDDELYELVNPGDLEKKLQDKKETKNKENKKADSSLNNLSTDALLDEI